MRRRLLQPEVVAPEDVEFDVCYTFRFRKHKSGNFSGLWQLCEMENDPKAKVVKEISDADAISYCLDNMHGRIEEDGY